MQSANANYRGQLDEAAAVAIGRRLQAAREQKSLAIPDIASQLLLSRNQVVGLETGSAASFYNAALYIQYADKYAALLGWDEKPAATLHLMPASTPDYQPSPPPSPVKRSWPAVRSRAAAAFAAGIIVIVAGSSVLLHSRFAIPATATATATAAVRPDASAASASMPTGVKAVPVNNPVAADTVELKVSGMTWIQIVDQAGVKTQKLYRSGDALTIEPQTLQALVIGDAKQVSASGTAGEIDLQQFVAPGSRIARLAGKQVRSLAQAATIARD